MFHWDKDSVSKTSWIHVLNISYRVKTRINRYAQQLTVHFTFTQHGNTWCGEGGVEVLRILGYRKSDGCLISVWGFKILPGVLRIELRFELILFKDFSW